jgi:hypothetical protein
MNSLRLFLKPLKCFINPTGDISSKHWMQLHGAQWPDFQRIAIRILTVGTSSLASERNFSTFAHVWNNRSNALSFETANMLVFCWHNIRALHQLRTGSAPKQTVAQAWLLDEIDE